MSVRWIDAPLNGAGGYIGGRIKFGPMGQEGT